VTGRRGKRRKQLLDDLKEKSGYWKLKGEAPDRTVENSLWKRHIWTFRKADNGMNVGFWIQRLFVTGTTLTALFCDGNYVKPAQPRRVVLRSYRKQNVFCTGNFDLLTSEYIRHTISINAVT